MTATLVPTQQIDAVWPMVGEGLESACQKTGGDLSAGSLWQQCRCGAAFLVVVHDNSKIIAASVWRPETWSSGEKLRCLSLYGENMSLWLHHLREVVEMIARQCGATSIITEGREGWQKIYPEARRLRILYEVNLDGR